MYPNTISVVCYPIQLLETQFKYGLSKIFQTFDHPSVNTAYWLSPATSCKRTVAQGFTNS